MQLAMHTRPGAVLINSTIDLLYYLILSTILANKIMDNFLAFQIYISTPFTYTFDLCVLVWVESFLQHICKYIGTYLCKEMFHEGTYTLYNHRTKRGVL